MLVETHDDQEVLARVAALDIGKAELVLCPGAGAGGVATSAAGGHDVFHDDRSLQVMVDRLLDLGVSRVVDGGHLWLGAT
jgi:hypothetical protein